MGWCTIRAIRHEMARVVATVIICGENMPTGKYLRAQKVVTCHPGRRHYAHGLCQQCYNQTLEAKLRRKAWKIAYRTSERVAWDNMIQRCTNPKHPQYEY